MSKIHRQDFVRQHGDKTVDLDKLEQDQVAKNDLAEAGVSTDKLRRADRNRDGKLDADEAFNVADDFDRDGSRGSLIDVDAAGRTTPAGEATSALGLLMQNRDVQGEPRAPRDPGRNDEVMLVGMATETIKRRGADYEVEKLRERGVHVEEVLDSKVGDDKIKVGGRIYDLTTESGLNGFVSTLGLPAEQSKEIAEAIAAVSHTTRSGAMSEGDALDEMAQIAQIWARAERGGSIPSRLILSGHCAGNEFWGDENGEIYFYELARLAKAMPKAAAQIEDLNISGCNSGGPALEKEFKETFPNIKTFWAYTGSSPDGASGAPIHQAGWERATRGDGRNVEAAAENLQRRGIRKSKNIYATEVKENVVHRGPPLDELREAARAEAPILEPTLRGERTVTDRSNGPLRGYYNRLQDLLRHPDLTGDDRRRVEQQKDLALRVLFYDSHIRHKFQDNFGDEINAGYRAVAMEPPDFSSLSRAEALASIEAFRSSMSSMSGAPQEAESLLAKLNSLYNLDHNIPSRWI